MRVFALLFAIFFLLFGITGAVHTLRTNDLFLHVFRANIWLESLYILSGIVSLWMITVSYKKRLLFFQILGSFYAMMALLGFVYGNNEVLGIFASNRPNTWLHMVIAIAALVLGYGSTD